LKSTLQWVRIVLDHVQTRLWNDGCVEERTTKGLLRREGDEEQSNGVAENLVAKMRPL